MNDSIRRRLAPFAAAAAVAVVAAAGATGVLPGGHRDPFTTPNEQPSVASSELQATANKTFEAFNGTVRQRNASGLLQAWSLNGAMDQCMDAAGFPQWDWSATQNLAPRTNALGVSRFFAAPNSHAYSRALMDTVVAARAEHRLRQQVLSPEEDAAVGRCLETTKPTSDSTADAASTPAVVRQLRDEWWAMLARLDQDLGDTDAYLGCFSAGRASFGLEAAVTGDTWQQYLAQHAPTPTDTPASASSPLATASAWRRFTDAEAQLETIDWTCRAQTYEAGIARVNDAVAAFAADHADQIARAQDEWAQIETRAAALDRGR